MVLRRASDGTIIARYRICDGCESSAAMWSPDGSRIAYVVTEHSTGVATLMIAVPGKKSNAAGGVPVPAERFVGLLSTPRWSPDGRSVALLATASPKKLSGAAQAGAVQVGEIGVAPDEQRIAIVSAEGGKLRFVSPADTFVYEYDWTPDGRGFVGTAAKGDGDDNWWVAKLVAFGFDGQERVIATPAMQMNAPRVSPDGRSVAFIGGLMSDFGITGGDVYIVPFDGGIPKNLTPGYKGSFTSLAWRGARIHATALAGDRFQSATIDPARHSVTAVDGPMASFTAADGQLSLSADGAVAAAAQQDFRTAPRIVVLRSGRASAITRDNDALPAHVAVKSITWKHEGFDGQGWLLTPALLTPGKRYPMIVVVHGGPSSAATPTYAHRDVVRDLIDHGYLVFQPNPRGSYGQGAAYVEANRRDFGGGDLRDILAGIDAAEKEAPIDDARLGIMGRSYGGFMAMWTVTQSMRFKAAVAGAGNSNWSSYYGENGIHQWLIPFFGKSFYEDPAVYDRISPIRYVRNARTPTFIYVGERDVEVPPGQSIEFWRGLTAYGVPTSLMIYGGEGHRFRKPENLQDVIDRSVAWFDKYLGPSDACAECRPSAQSATK
jgi:dipeptidyl aminopeptidase/acylaminoacyl peptidase